MAFRITAQADNIMPPRLFRAADGSPTAPHPSGVLVQAVDGTSRAYNIALLPLGGKAVLGGVDHVYLTLQAQTADIFFAFSNATGTIDDTGVNTAGTALSATTMTTTMPFRLIAGSEKDICIERNTDTWLILKCAGAATATLRMYASSQAEV